MSDLTLVSLVADLKTLEKNLNPILTRMMDVSSQISHKIEIAEKLLEETEGS